MFVKILWSYDEIAVPLCPQQQDITGSFWKSWYYTKCFPEDMKEETGDFPDNTGNILGTVFSLIE